MEADLILFFFSFFFFFTFSGHRDTPFLPSVPCLPVVFSRRSPQFHQPAIFIISVRSGSSVSATSLGSSPSLSPSLKCPPSRWSSSPPSSWIGLHAASEEPEGSKAAFSGVKVGCEDFLSPPGSSGFVDLESNNNNNTTDQQTIKLSIIIMM